MIGSAGLHPSLLLLNNFARKMEKALIGSYLYSELLIGYYIEGLMLLKKSLFVVSIINLINKYVYAVD